MLVTDGTLYANVNGVEYAEPEGYVRYLKPGDKVHFIARKAYSELLFEYAEFILISVQDSQDSIDETNRLILAAQKKKED